MRFWDGSDVTYAKIVYCVQKPFMVCLCDLQKLPKEPDISASDYWEQRRDRWLHEFRLQLGSFAWTDDGGIDPEWQVDVLTDVINQRHGRLVTDASWRPMSEVCDWFESHTASVEPDHIDEEVPKVPEEWVELPWLLEEFTFDEQKTGKMSNEDGAEPIAETIAELMAESTAEQVLDALYDRREAFAASAPAPLRDFGWVIRGGTWAIRSVGVPYGSFRGDAKTAEGIRFCELFGLSKSATYAIRQHTESLAQELAVEWCTRRQFWFDIWDAAGRTADFQFTADDWSSYVERPALAQALGVAGPATLQRAMQLR